MEESRLNHCGIKAENIAPETVAAIAMALSQHAGANVHDKESYTITIRRKIRPGDVFYK